jgi:toxin-antitoxin system PIN domain toxin
MTSTDPTVLLDVNLLVALAWPNHVHHDAALAWWRGRGVGAWATCPATQFGFVRVSSNRHVVREAKTPGEAVVLLTRIVAQPGHVFWIDDISIMESAWIDVSRIIGHRQVTDAHLVALAIRHGGRIATFDRSLGEAAPAGADRDGLIELLGPLPLR